MNLADPVTAHLRRDVRPLRAETTVEAALASLRGAILPERIVYFYVQDADGRLRGVVPTRRLLAAEEGATVGSCMVGPVVSLPITATLRDASEAFLRHRLLALPVMDEDGRLAGTIDISLFSDDLVAGQGREAIDDVFQTIGVHVARDRQRGPWGAFRGRFPWLLANIGGGLLCAVLVSRFERFLDTAIVLALFMPVVLALAESASIQSMLPTAVRALRLDPKLAAGPITLALADVAALLFYFTIGTRLLG